MYMKYVVCEKCSVDIKVAIVADQIDLNIESLPKPN